MIELIISSSALILIVITLRYILKGKISLRLQYALWLVVLVRLLMPISMGDSRISIMNVVEHSALYESAKQTFSETQRRKLERWEQTLSMRFKVIQWRAVADTCTHIYSQILLLLYLHEY
jgi:beta-lactamase regulating signal transducer with metallopeptidase domain